MNLLKCHKCGNEKKFVEVHVGGERHHQWIQEKNGRFVFHASNYDRVEDHIFKCGECGTDLSGQYRRFLQALFEPYDDKKHGV